MNSCNNFASALQKIREAGPLVHCITNYVAMEFNAEALLAVGASPLMSFCAEEMEDIAASADTLVVNIGCLDRFQIDAMKIAAAAMDSSGKAWILDPAGIGASRFRTEISLALAGEFHPSVIRGNASEIISLEGMSGKGKGVDSTDDSEDALNAAKAVARRFGTVVCVSGKTDIITDGSAICRVEGGHPMMGRVTAMGCTASAITGAFLAVCDSPFDATVDAMTLMARAGEKAASVSNGTASLRINFIDSLLSL